jgi:predicted porin
MRKLLLASVAALGVYGGVTDVAQAQTFPNAPSGPTPGSVVVRLNGRFRFYAGLGWDNDVRTNGYKANQYQFQNYARLYPGFDGVAANGLKYGANLEIRSDNGGAAVAAPSGASPTHGELYLRREWGYLGTDQLGTLRVGSTDNPSSLYITGNFENFNDGGWNGDAPNFIASNAGLVWPFSDIGNMYTTNKVVYLSPQFFGFDFGVSFEPNTQNLTASNGCPGNISTGCAALTSGVTAADVTRRKNTWNPLIRYRGSFGAFGIAATAAYIGSGSVQNGGNPTLPTYSGLSLGDFGAAVTFGGLSVGGKYQFGTGNNGFLLQRQGAKEQTTWLVGASYTLGPWIFGAHYLDIISAGFDPGTIAVPSSLGSRREQGLAVGATYSVSPGLAVFLSYLWDQRKQGGYDFISNTAITSSSGTTRSKVHGQAASVGLSFAW